MTTKPESAKEYPLNYHSPCGCFLSLHGYDEAGDPIVETIKECPKCTSQSLKAGDAEECPPDCSENHCHCGCYLPPNNNTNTTNCGCYCHELADEQDSSSPEQPGGGVLSPQEVFGASLEYGRINDKLKWLNDAYARCHAELVKLQRMKTHCERCGGDYVATGVEVGCSCRLRQQLTDLQRGLEERDKHIDNLMVDINNKWRMINEREQFLSELRDQLAAEKRRADDLTAELSKCAFHQAFEESDSDNETLHRQLAAEKRYSEVQSLNYQSLVDREKRRADEAERIANQIAHKLDDAKVENYRLRKALEEIRDFDGYWQSNGE